MKLYDENGYVNWKYILSMGLPFNFVIGGRGTGKTYGILKETLELSGKVMFLRRTQTQIDMVTTPMYNPYKQINKDLMLHPWRGFLQEKKNICAIYDFEENEDGEPIPVSGPYGYATALSTIKNMRGLGVGDVDYLLFDEFIPESHEKEIRFEGNAFLNAYETINRNRELNGDKPLTAILMANSNSVSTILVELGLISPLNKMYETGKEEYIDRKRGLGIWVLMDSPISQAKSQTALYRLAGEDYKRMALENKFGIDFQFNVVSRNIKEYRPLAALNELCVYIHKSQKKFYVTTHKSGSPIEFPCNKDGFQAFRRWFGISTVTLDTVQVEYETELCQILFTRLLKK